ncbi:MAG: dTMP kinase [Bdellovibrionales bacterium]|nr:dTMP kinase [Bdellovibrionales bacterium]
MRFLAFEGLDGSGKSTLMQGLRSEFKKRGLPFVDTREPGGTPLGQQIRQLLLTVEGEAPVPRAEALLYQADRAQNVETLIKPALAKGTWVFSDRHAASSVAFQTGGRALAAAEIEWLNTFSTGGLKPDLYVLLDLTVEESRRRLDGRGQDADRFEREKSDFHERVRGAYLRMAKEEPGLWLVLDASDKPDAMLGKLIEALKKRKWLD